jgi:hypothetical protein
MRVIPTTPYHPRQAAGSCSSCAPALCPSGIITPSTRGRSLGLWVSDTAFVTDVSVRAWSSCCPSCLRQAMRLLALLRPDATHSRRGHQACPLRPPARFPPPSFLGASLRHAQAAQQGCRTRLQGGPDGPRGSWRPLASLAPQPGASWRSTGLAFARQHAPRRDGLVHGAPADAARDPSAPGERVSPRLSTAAGGAAAPGAAARGTFGARPLARPATAGRRPLCAGRRPAGGRLRPEARAAVGTEAKTYALLIP